MESTQDTGFDIPREKLRRFRDDAADLALHPLFSPQVQLWFESIARFTASVAADLPEERPAQ